MQYGNLSDNGKPEQVKFPMVGSCGNCVKKTDTKHELESIVSSSGSDHHKLNVQGGELLCLNGDVDSGGRTMNQKNIKEEHRCL